MIPQWLADSPELVHVHRREAREGEAAAFPAWLPDGCVASLRAGGIAAPWRHQAEAADAIWRGTPTALATGTASGKTLAYVMPILAATCGDAAANVGVDVTTLRDQLVSPRRRHTALYLAPTKALAHDQWRACRRLGGDGWRVAALDGDSSDEERRYARDAAGYVLTNPDMLHHAVLPNHARWAPLLRTLRYVVIDEAHRYRGVFGAHVAAVLRRLRRLCAQYGSHPTFVCSSATATNAAEAMARLTAEPEERIRVFDADTSPHGALTFGLWRPSQSLSADASRLVAEFVDAGRQTIAFVGSRVLAELVAVRAQEQVTTGAAVAAYRAGYLADDRRSLEAALQSGALTGVAATNALELGVDIAGMDAVVIAGFPGTLASLWQQAGRAGRAGRDAVVLLVAKEDPLDAYLFDHPDLLFDTPVESTVLHPANPHVLGPHLCAAAQETALTEADADWFGPTMSAVADRLVAAGLLRRRPQGWFWTRPERAAAAIDLRSMGGRPIDVVDRVTGRVVGTVDVAAADRTVFPGAVYLHQGEQWVVEQLDFDEHVALVRWERPGYYTQALGLSDVRILHEVRRRSLGQATLCFGHVEMISHVTSYLRRDEITGDVWDESPLELPERRYQTEATWWVLPHAASAAIGLDGIRLGAAAHAAEHTAIGLLSAFAPCDRWDIGGLSTVLHPDTGECTVFVHDGHPGGAGFAEVGYERAEAWLTATLQRLRECPCEAGCPACCVSPKCGNANQHLSKPDAARFLGLIVEA